MARPLRIEFPGAFYHVTSRGNERKAVFRSRRDREQFLSYLESATERYGAVIHAYCLMDNHYHLLIETPLGNLSKTGRGGHYGFQDESGNQNPSFNFDPWRLFRERGPAC